MYNTSEGKLYHGAYRLNYFINVLMQIQYAKPNPVVKFAKPINNTKKKIYR